MKIEIISAFSAYCKERKLSFRQSAELVGTSKGSLHEIFQGKRKCPAVVAVKMVQSLERSSLTAMPIPSYSWNDKK